MPHKDQVVENLFEAGIGVFEADVELQNVEKHSWQISALVAATVQKQEGALAFELALKNLNRLPYPRRIPVDTVQHWIVGGLVQN